MVETNSLYWKASQLQMFWMQTPRRSCQFGQCRRFWELKTKTSKIEGWEPLPYNWSPTVGSYEQHGRVGARSMVISGTQEKGTGFMCSAEQIIKVPPPHLIRWTLISGENRLIWKNNNSFQLWTRSGRYNSTALPVASSGAKLKLIIFRCNNFFLWHEPTLIFRAPL